jgi:hypothetical protein
MIGLAAMARYRPRKGGLERIKALDAARRVFAPLIDN